MLDKVIKWFLKKLILLWEGFKGVADWNFCPNCGADMRPTSMSGANGEES